MEALSDNSFLPFILRSQQQREQWPCLRDMSADVIDWHKVIFSISYALQSLHERDRTYGAMNIDDVFYQSSQDGSQVYKLLDKESVTVNEKDKDWKSFAVFMLHVLYFIEHKKWSGDLTEQSFVASKGSLFHNSCDKDVSFCLEIAELLLINNKTKPQFLKTIPEVLLDWYKTEADFQRSYTFNHCLCCTDEKAGTLHTFKDMKLCSDECSGYYCNHCLKSHNMEQFCQHHGPQSKGLKFSCSKCREFFGTCEEWATHSDCTAFVPSQASTLKIGTWNVTKLEKESDLIWLLLEMNALQLDILGISEFELTDPGKEFTYVLYGERYRIIASGEKPNRIKIKQQKALKGVAWIVKERGLGYVRVTPDDVSEPHRILTIVLSEKTDEELVLTQIYAPPYKKDADQNMFYEGMKKLRQGSVIAGDFNETIISCKYCCLSRRRLLSGFCSMKGLIVSNMWPSDEEPVTKAQNDFILITTELWKKRCTSSAKKFIATYDSDHPFPVVTSLIFEEAKLNPSPETKCPATEAQEHSHSVNCSNPELFQWYENGKRFLTEKMAEVKCIVKKVLMQEVKVKEKDNVFLLPLYDHDLMAESVSGHLLELYFCSCQEKAEIDDNLLSSLLDGPIEKQTKEDLVQLLKVYRKSVLEIIKEGRSKSKKLNVIGSSKNYRT